MSKILIVEDDIYLLKLYQEIFSKENFEVEIAEDGEEAIKKSKQFLPEIILLDLMLPYVDGFGVLKEIKSDQQTKGAIVVVFTNLDSEIQKEKATGLGAAKFLVKSDQSPVYLLEEVKKLISKS